MKAAILVLTDQGLRTAQRIIISQKMNEEGNQDENFVIWLHKNCQSDSAHRCGNQREPERPYSIFQELKTILPRLWTECTLLIFVMASGIVVRHIAPLLQSKDRDPAVLVLDEKGEFVIPLLSGHLGGANAWARKISQGIGAQPVLTTATDVQGLTAPDEYARQLGWRVQPLVRLHQVNRFLLENEYLNVWSDFELPANHPLRLDKHYRFLTEDDKSRAHIWISVQEQNINVGTNRASSSSELDTPLTLIPKVFSIGVGCRRGTSKERILEAVDRGMKQLGISTKSIQGINSIDLKADELGIREAAEILGVPFQTFTAEQVQVMNQERGLTRSGYVREKIGVDGVCEGASLLGTKKGELILPKQKLNGVTVAISMEKSLSWELDPVI
jgi:cobalt-precorrin 5A hydrolase